jgi:hypothetical protein
LFQRAAWNTIKARRAEVAFPRSAWEREVGVQFVSKGVGQRCSMSAMMKPASVKVLTSVAKTEKP